MPPLFFQCCRGMIEIGPLRGQNWFFCLQAKFRKGQVGREEVLLSVTPRHVVVVSEGSLLVKVHARRRERAVI